MRRSLRRTRSAVGALALAVLLVAGAPVPSALAAPTFSLEDADAVGGFPASDTLIALGFPGVGGADLLAPALGFQAFGPSPPPGVVVAFGALGLPPPLLGPGSVDIDALSFGTDPITLLTGGPDHIVFSADRHSAQPSRLLTAPARSFASAYARCILRTRILLACFCICAKS